MSTGPPHVDMTLCRFRPEHAAGVRACVLAVHGEHYPQRALYSAEALTALDASGAWLGAVALDADGEVAGFAALQPSAHGPVAELGMVMVLPAYRRRGAAERLRDFQLGQARALSLAGQYVEVSTIDTAAQVIANRARIVPCGLTLGLWPDYRGEAAGTRLSFVRYYRSFESAQPLRAYLPEQHHDIAKAIAKQLGRPLQLCRRGEAPALNELPAYIEPSPNDVSSANGEPPADIEAPANGVLTIDRQPEIGVTVVAVKQIGLDTLALVEQAISAFENAAQMQSLYLDMPLDQPGAAELCTLAEQRGLFFSSLTPRLLGAGDALRLQRLKSDPDLARLQVLHPFAKQLYSYMAAERERIA